MSADALLLRGDSGDQGTFGRILARGVSFSFTGELPWRDNATGASCIPAGRYRVVWAYSPRFKRPTYLLLDTAPRVVIREHPANLMGDIAKGFRAQLNGCIALGEKLGWIDGQKALLISAPAVRRFETLMERKPFVLEIRQ
jgi:hypothetical protein